MPFCNVTIGCGGFHRAVFALRVRVFARARGGGAQCSAVGAAASHGGHPKKFNFDSLSGFHAFTVRWTHTQEFSICLFFTGLGFTTHNRFRVYITQQAIPHNWCIDSAICIVFLVD